MDIGAHGGGGGRRARKTREWKQVRGKQIWDRGSKGKDRAD